MDAGSAGTGIEHWVIIPQGHPGFDTWAYIILVALIIAPPAEGLVANGP